MDKKLKISVYRKDSILYLVPEGQIVSESSGVLKKTGEAIISPSIDQFIIHLGRVDFIDSSGLGVLVALKVACSNDKTHFLILEPSPQVSDIFKVAKLDAIFEIVRGAEAEVTRGKLETKENRILVQDNQSPVLKAMENAPRSSSSTSASASGEDRRNPQALVESYCREAVEKVRLGEYQRAVELYQQALSIDPEHLTALNNLAVVYEKKAIWTMRAIETWEKVLGISQKNRDSKHQERAERRLTKLREGLNARE